MPEETVNPQVVQPEAEKSLDDWFKFEDDSEVTLGAGHFTYAEDDVVPGSDGTAGTAPAQEQSAPPQTSQVHDYEKRYKDLQSYHDRKRVEWESEQKAASQKLAEYDQLKALRDAIVSDQYLLSTVEGALTGRNTQPAQQQVQMPQPPADFDPMDAMNPSTPSGQWYQAMLQHQIRNAVGDVQSLPQTVTQNVLSVLEQREQQRLQVEQQRQRDAAMRAEFEQFEAAHADLSQEQKEQFVAFLSGGPNALGMERLSLENLYALYTMVTGAQVQQPKPAVNPQDVLASRIRQVQSAVPPSVTQIPADGSTAPQSEEEYFNASLMRSGKPKWTIYK